MEAEEHKKNGTAASKPHGSSEVMASRRRDRKKSRSSSDSQTSDSSDEDDSSSSSGGERERRERRKKRRKEREEKRRQRRKEKKEKRRQRRKDEGEESDDDEGRKKEERRKRKKKRRKHGSSSESDDNEKRRKRKLLKEAKAFLEEHEGKDRKHKRKEAPAKIVVLVPQDKITPITEDDYFVRNLEFSTWLREARNLFFSDLTADRSRELFSEFVRVWNAGGLVLKFYEGAFDKAPRSAHRWAILGRGETAAALAAEEEERFQAARGEERRDRKRKNKEHDLVMEELVPKATGREAMLEKKAARRQEAKEREVSPEPMRERDIMGGGDDFQQRLARERAFRDRKNRVKQEVIAEKRSVYDEKEAAKMDHFRQLVGMAGGKITIPKRNDQPQPPD